MKDIAIFMMEFGLILLVMALVWLFLVQLIREIRDEIKWRQLKDE